MRIGIDYRSALVNREGIGRATREIVRALVELGHGEELALFGWTLAPMRFTREELGLDGGDARLHRLRFPSRWIAPLCERTGRGVDDMLGGCDVFHHTQSHLLPVRSAREVATIYDCIYMRNNGSVSESAAQMMTTAAREMVARSKRIIVPSVFVAREVVARLGAEPAHIQVALLGCDHVVRDGRPVSLTAKRERTALTVSRVDTRKNHVRVLRAVERLVADGLLDRWVVAGPDGHGVEEFDAAIAASPARDRVERLQHVADRDLAELYRRTSLFLFCSLDEGFGLPPLEAMACGAPVVAGDNSSMPEVLGTAALLVDAADVEAIFEAARSILSKPDLARDLQRRGLERAGELTWKSCALSVRRAYEAALD